MVEAPSATDGIGWGASLTQACDLEVLVSEFVQTSACSTAVELSCPPSRTFTWVLANVGGSPPKMLSDSNKPFGGVMPFTAFEQTGSEYAESMIFASSGV